MPADPKALTFQAAHQYLMRELDEAWSDLRAVYADLSFVNDMNGDYKTAKERIKEVQESVWRLKASWSDQN